MPRVLTYFAMLLESSFLNIKLVNHSKTEDVQFEEKYDALSAVFWHCLEEVSHNMNF